MLNQVQHDIFAFICHSEPCAEFISVSFRNLLCDLVPNANLCNLILGLYSVSPSGFISNGKISSLNL